MAAAASTSEKRLFRLPITGVVEGAPPRERFGFWLDEPPDSKKDMSEDCIVAIVESPVYMVVAPMGMRLS